MKKTIFAALLLLINFVSYGQVPPRSANHIAYQFGVDVGGNDVKPKICELVKNQFGGITSNVVFEYKPIKAGLGKNMNTTKLLNSEDIRFAVNQLKTIVNEIKADKDLKITPNNIYIVTSSGINKSPNISDFSDAVMKELGIKVDNSMTVDEEAAYTTRASMTRDNYDEASTWDVGGGNSKGGYLDKYTNSKGKVKYMYNSLSFQYGAKSLMEKFQQSTTDYLTYKAQLNKYVYDSLVPPLKSRMRDLPDLQERKVLYVSGGVAYMMATYLNPYAYNSDVEFTYADVERFRVMSSSQELWDEFLNRRFPDEVVQAEYKRALTVYTKEGVYAGMTLIKAYIESLSNNPNKLTLIFPRRAQWIVPYMKDSYTPN